MFAVDDTAGTQWEFAHLRFSVKIVDKDLARSDCSRRYNPVLCFLT